MRDARLAQWMLSLVTTPDRAASTVGDLLEGRETGGAIRFWASVLFTALALLWRDLAASPLRMAGLAIYGMVLQMFFTFIFMIAIFVAGIAWGSRWGTFAPPVDPSTLPGAITIALFTIVTQYQVGRVLARRSPGREMVPCIATTVLGYVIPITIVIMSSGPADLPTRRLLTELLSPAFMQVVMFQILPVFALLAGAARIRRQHFRADVRS